jgi:hypothetical protein
MSESVGTYLQKMKIFECLSYISGVDAASVQGHVDGCQGDRARPGAHVPEPRSGRHGLRIHAAGDRTHPLLGQGDGRQ